MFLKAGPIPPWGIGMAEVQSLIENLRRSIGADVLERRVAEYRKRLKTADGIGVVRLRERQLVLEGFESYRKKTLGGGRRLSSTTKEIALLANVAGLNQILRPTLTDAVRRNHMGRLINIDGQLSPLLVEWAMAGFYARAHHAELAWLETSTAGPELVARSGNLEWELECKQLTPMITELLGDAEADELAAHVMNSIEAAGYCGEFVLTVPATFRSIEEGDVAALKKDIYDAIKSGPCDLTLVGGLNLSGLCMVAAGNACRVDEWKGRLEAIKQADCRLYAKARAESGRAADSLVLQLSGPRRTSSDLLEYLWERKFKKAASQCTGVRGAVLAFEWSGIESPSVFAESEGMQALMARTFDEYRHIAAIAMRCASSLSAANSALRIDTSAYVVASQVTSFPEIAALRHLDSEDDQRSQRKE